MLLKKSTSFAYVVIVKGSRSSSSSYVDGLLSVNDTRVFVNRNFVMLMMMMLVRSETYCTQIFACDKTSATILLLKSKWHLISTTD